MNFVDGDAARSRRASGRRSGGYVARRQGNFFDHGEVHHVRTVQASSSRSNNVQSEVMRTGEEWHRGVRTGDGGRKSHVDFMAIHDGNGSAERGYIVAIQADLQRSRAETRTKNFHWTDGLRRGTQCDF